VGWEVDGTGLALCPVADLGISSDKPFGSGTRELSA